MSPVMGFGLVSFELLSVERGIGVAASSDGSYQIRPSVLYTLHSSSSSSDL